MLMSPTVHPMPWLMPWGPPPPPSTGLMGRAIPAERHSPHHLKEQHHIRGSITQGTPHHARVGGTTRTLGPVHIWGGVQNGAPALLYLARALRQ